MSNAPEAISSGLSGIDVAQLQDTVSLIRAQPALAEFQRQFQLVTSPRHGRLRLRAPREMTIVEREAPATCAFTHLHTGGTMNGIHDLGGMTCFGPVRREDNEPVFHADWERRVFGMNMAALAFLGPVDRARHAIERMDPVEYLNTSYYEHWLAALVTLATDLGYLTDEEIEKGRVIKTKETPHPPPNAEMAAGLLHAGMPATRNAGRTDPAYRPGDKVRARNLEIKGHTRLARYVRGKLGTVHAHHGSHVFPDTVAHDLGENPQPLYTVRFEAKTLWGDNVDRRDCVYIDLWEDYLEPADRSL